MNPSSIEWTDATWHPAGPTKRQLRKLSRGGIGYKRVAKVAGVSSCVLGQVLSGKRKRVRARTERRVLAVRMDAHAPNALVPAAPV